MRYRPRIQITCAGIFDARSRGTSATIDRDFSAPRESPQQLRTLFRGGERFEIGLRNLRREKLYFSENPDQTKFFTTVDGQPERVFDPANPPAVVTTQGSLEDWTIQNRGQENHEFHFHQIHFMVLSQDHFRVNGSQPVQALQGQLMDMIEIPYWMELPATHTQRDLRMDFRGPDIGDFVYHCHILNHEDQGMMAIIRVLPGPGAATRAVKHNGSSAKTEPRDVHVRKVAMK